MSVTNKHSLFGVEFNATLLGAIVAQRIYLGSEVRAEPVSGEVYARNIAIVQRRPGATFSTLAIAAGLTQLPVAGLSVASLGTGLKFYAQKHLEGGTRTAGATHRKYTGVKGIVVPRKLTCEFKGDARLDAEYLATYDGTNDPIVEADTTSLPAGITDAERFTIGKWTVGGIVLDHITGIEIDLGIMVELDAADNDIFPRFASIQTYKPKITLKGLDVEWLKAAKIPRAGIACTPANTIGYLQKRTQDSASLVALATVEHVKFTAAGIAVIEDAFNADGQKSSEQNLCIYTKYDGTANSPLAVTTASAIT